MILAYELIIQNVLCKSKINNVSSWRVLFLFDDPQWIIELISSLHLWGGNFERKYLIS